MAVLPAILVAIFAAVSLNLGIEAWFSQRVQTALDNSVSVADAYVEEHKQVIRGDILAMAFDDGNLDRIPAPVTFNIAVPREQIHAKMLGDNFSGLHANDGCRPAISLNAKGIRAHAEEFRRGYPRRQRRSIMCLRFS